MEPQKIERYRERLRQMQTRLQDEFDSMSERVVQDIRAPGDVTNMPTHLADSDTEGLHEEIALEKTEGQLLDEVRLALRRIEEGSFGRCTDCGRPIAQERLEALPHTPRCINCERKFESGVELQPE